MNALSAALRALDAVEEVARQLHARDALARGERSSAMLAVQRVARCTAHSITFGTR